MPTKHQRFSVTFSDPASVECLKMLSQKKNISASSLISKIVEDFLEDYEDMILAQRAEKAYQASKGKKTHTHEEVWNELGI
ncbi:MAG: DUF6290 family protein [Chlamydiales bacterium]|nr:DUF6290 family protein [Chlamydiales bacterium]